MRSDYAERQARRKQRLEERADAARVESRQRLDRAHSHIAGIPPGQPILVGHHSERRHRGALERHDRDMRKGFELDAKAKDLACRAAGVGKAGISSDDPEAIKKLKGEIEKAEADQEHMKAANKIVKSKLLTDDDKVRNLVEQGLMPSEALARKLLAPDFCGRTGFAGYQLTNNSANIRRMKERLKRLEEERAEQADALENDQEERVMIEGRGFRAIENFGVNRMQVEFDAKPDREVREFLRQNGFIWAPSQNRHQRLLNNGARNVARYVMRRLDEMLAPMVAPSKQEVLVNTCQVNTGHPEPRETLFAEVPQQRQAAGDHPPLTFNDVAEALASDSYNVRTPEGYIGEVKYEGGQVMANFSMTDTPDWRPLDLARCALVTVEQTAREERDPDAPQQFSAAEVVFQKARARNEPMTFEQAVEQVIEWSEKTPAERAQMVQGMRLGIHGAPPVCTAKWTDRDFTEWERQQHRLRDHVAVLEMLGTE